MADALKRQVGVFGAVMMGLGSIVGTGVFVSLGLGAGVAGAGVVLALVFAGALAACNGLSSAQLAAAHPVSGGTYEYGYRYLHPALGFSAGWMFLAAKSASAATAALGFAGYLIHLQPQWHDGFASLDIVLALGAVAGLTVVVLTGLRRSSAMNVTIVSVTLFALIAFVVVGIGSLAEHVGEPWIAEATAPREASGMVPGLLEATALMFVAYTGYGRIATLGEEITEPARNIPRAIIATLAVTVVLYVAVASVAVAAVGAERFAELTVTGFAPLEAIARELLTGSGGSALAIVVFIGAVTAMLGVLLNLILGLSRVALAMGRRGDLPATFGRINAKGTTPTAAVMLVAIIIAGLVCLGSVKVAWSFSAFTVLIYYGLTNAAALRLPPGNRLYPRVFSWLGLLGCLGLAWWVDWRYVLAGLALLAVGLVWHAIARQTLRREPGRNRDRR